MNQFIKINNVKYPLFNIIEQMNDIDWDFRNTKTIFFENMTYEQINNIFKNSVNWELVLENIINIYDEETGEIIDTSINEINIDQSDYLITGPITDYKNGIISVKMGQLTELEEAYEFLYGE